jgi:hypothetical protein
MYLRADYRWLDAYPNGNAETAGFVPLQNEFRNPAYSTLNLRLGLVHSGADVSLYVNNLTHADPVLSYVQAVPSTLSYIGTVRPLTAGVTALFRF